MSENYEKIDDNSFKKVEIKTEETIYTVEQIKAELNNVDREIGDYEKALENSKDKKAGWERLLEKAQELDITIEEKPKEEE